MEYCDSVEEMKVPAFLFYFNRKYRKADELDECYPTYCLIYWIENWIE